MLVQFDPRGGGLSERDVADFSLQARLGDLVSVLDSVNVPVVEISSRTHTVGRSLSVTRPGILQGLVD